MRYFKIFLPLTLSLLAACGASDDDNGGGGAPVTVEDSGGVIAAALCGKFDECCDWADLGVAGITDRASCETLLTGLFDDNQSDYQVALDRGTVRYDAAAAGTCYRQIQQRDCGTPLLLATEACASVWTPLAADGEACTFDLECVSELCAFSDEADTEGTCARPRDGEPCALSCAEFDGERSCYHTCSGELRCNTTFEGSGEPVSTCLTEVLVEVGESCEDASCADGAWCNFEGFVCAAEREAGQSCEDDRECASDLCTDGACAAENACNSFL